MPVVLSYALYLCTPNEQDNQAYFALYGIYAESAGSVSPIGEQLREFRSLVPTTGDFVKEISQISSYSDFLEELKNKKSKINPTSS